MGTTQLKEELHQYIDQGDKKLLLMMQAMAKAYFEEDDLLEESIDRGVKQSKSGQVQPHHEVMAAIRSKYSA